MQKSQFFCIYLTRVIVSAAPHQINTSIQMPTGGRYSLIKKNPPMRDFFYRKPWFLFDSSKKKNEKSVFFNEKSEN